MLKVHPSLIRVLSIVAVIATQLVQASGPLGLPVQSAPAPAVSSPAMPFEQPAWVVNLTVAPHTIEITAVGFRPDLVQITAGQTVTVTNQDARTRLISFNSVTPQYKVFLPLIQRQGSAAATIPAPAAAGTVSDVITLAPGQSVTRVFGTAGNVTVNDAENPSVAATILVTPLSLPRQGAANGFVQDYHTKAPIAGARVKALDTNWETTTDASGHYSLLLPGGDYNLVAFATGYSFANRTVKAQSYTPTDVDTIELVPLDSTITPIGGAGGVATNSISNTNVVFASGAVSSTKAMRLTWLPVNAQTGDFAALPGLFTDGNMPIGFVMFEPDGTQFTAPVTWTIEYTGDLPIGTYTPCYYWIESEARWGDPVPGHVVDLGSGRKGLQAVLPHFSSYGFAPPPPPIPDPPQAPPEAPDDPTRPDGPEDNPESPENECPAGSQINLISGELCQTVGTLNLPTVGALPTQITAKYRSLDLASTYVISTAFGPESGALTPQATWTFEIAGRTFSGAGKHPFVEWDGRDGNGALLPPGAQMGTLTAHWTYDYSYTQCGYPTPPNCRSVHMISYFIKAVPWLVQIKRSDLSPWGIGWFSPHDTLLIDRGDTVSLVQGDGRQVSFVRQSDSTYRPPQGDFSVLAQLPDGGWTLTRQDGNALTFDGDGRLIRIADRYGNFQSVLYEANGKTVPAGSWGLTTRIRRVLDSSGNQWDYAYDANGWLSSITDSTGRLLHLSHDAQGRLTSAADPLNQTESFTYNTQSFMTSHTNRRGDTTNYVLDSRGRVVTRAWPSGTNLQISYGRLQVNLLTDRGTPYVTTLDNSYSPVQRYNGVYTMTTVYNTDLLPASSDTPPQQILYDVQGNVVDAFTARHTAYDYGAPFQQVSRIMISDGTDTHFEYDAAGSLTRMTDALGQPYQMSYDARGQLLSIADPLGHVTSFVHNAHGQVTRITDPLNRVFDFTFDAAGNRISSRDPLSRTTHLEYDALNRLVAATDALNGHVTIQYDPNGNITRIADQTSRPISYTYDALNRVTGVTYADGGTMHYTYDGDGSINGFTDARGIPQTFSYNAARQLTRKAVAGEPEVDYTYDRLDQLTGMTDGVLTQTLAYVSGTVGYPLTLQQQANGLPLNATVEYQYSQGLVRPIGSAPIRRAGPLPEVNVPVPPRADVLQASLSPTMTNPAPVPPEVALPAPVDDGRLAADRAVAAAVQQRLDAELQARLSLTFTVPAPVQPADTVDAQQPDGVTQVQAATCTSIANGNWGSAATWSCGRVPLVTDTVAIDGEGVTLDVPVIVDGLVLTSGTLQGSNPITVTAVFTFTGGTLAGNGLTDTFTIATGATAYDGEIINNRTIHNLGTWTFPANSFIGLQNAVVLDNQGSLTFGDGTVYDYGGSGTRVLDNAGSLVKSSGSGTLIINVPFNNHGTVQLNAGNLHLNNNGSDTGSYAIPSGTALQFTGGTRVLNTGAVLGGAGDVSVSGSALTLSGTYAITGTTTINGGLAHFETAAGAVTFPTLTLSSGTLDGHNALTVARAFTFTGGALAGSGLTDTFTIAAGATAYDGEIINNRTVHNLGQWTFPANAFIGLQNAVVLDNQGSLTFGDGTVYDYGGSGTRVLDNAGSLVKSSGSGTLIINVPFNNHGTVQLNAGNLHLNNNGSDTGSYAIPSGTALQFTGGTRVLNTGAVLGGAGDVSVSGSALTLSGTYAITGTTTINGGLAHFETAAGAVTFPTLTLSSGTLDGHNALTVARAFTFTGGALAGSGLTDTFTIAAGATAYDGEIINNRTVHNLGQWTFPANAFIGLQNAVVLDNQGSLTFGDGTVYDYGGSGTRVLDNAGSLVKSSGSGTLIINVPFNNHGTVQLNAGNLHLNNNGSDTGSYAIPSGTALQFTGGTRVLNTGAVLGGAGDVSVSGSALTLSGTYAITGTTTINGGLAHFETAAGAVTFPTLTLSSGTLDGHNALTVARAFTFTGGALAGSGLTDTFTIAAGATAYDGEIINNRTVHNLGQWTFPANAFIGLQNAVVLDNQGSLTFGDGTVYDYGGSGNRVLNNAGSLVKSTGSGLLAIYVPFNNSSTVQLNTGRLSLSSFRQTDGQMTLNGGFLSGNSLIFDGGLLTGPGTVNGDVVNNGAIVSPGASPGALTIVGSYRQGLAGTLHIQLGGTMPAITFDVLNVTNLATLSGTLDVALINGFTPTRAASFPVLTFGSHSGQFATVNNPISATHPVTYADHSVVLGVVPPTFVLPGDGRLSGISLVSNANRAQTLGLAYDVLGRQTGLRSTGYSTYTLAYAYDAAGYLTTRTTSEGHTPGYSYAYDAAGQITHITLSNTAATELLHLDYAYDAAGNITAITSSRDGATTYNYDALNRLTGISSPSFNTTYAYDAAGNRTSANGVTFNYDAAGRLSSSSDGASYTYDAAGNLLTRTRNGQTDTFQWTGQGRLARITYTDGTFSAYAYDAAGRRIRQHRRDGTLTYYTYLGSNLAQELDASGGVIASYTYDGLDRPVSMWRRDAGPGGQTYFYLLDQLGNVLGLADENGVTVATYRYDPWGNVISSTGSITNPLRFTAREWDEDSGLYYDRARYYDPGVGRFISRDRLGINGGLNHYTYVSNNPVRFRDPLGLLTDTQCQVIQNMLEFEQEHGTWETARKFSNTPGFYDEQTPMGDVFDNGDTDTPYGVVDLDWFTDILAFGGAGDPIDEAFGIPNIGADILYYWGKTIWNLTRDSTGQGAGAAPYEDYKETRALELLNSYIDTYAELFPASFMETACQQKCMGE